MDRAISETFPIYEESWKSSAEIKLSENEFGDNFILHSVSFYKSGNSEASFTCGEAFSGHYVNARLDADREVTEVAIEDV